MKTQTDEIRDMSLDEIRKNIAELQTALMKERAEGPIDTGSGKETHKSGAGSSIIEDLRRDIARHKTILKEKENDSE